MDIKVKKSWAEVSIKDYKRIEEICKRELDSELEKDIAVLAVLSGVDEDTIYSLPIIELRGLIDQIKWLSEDYDFPKEWKTNKLKIDGEEYIINPNINTFTVAQYADFQVIYPKKEDNMGRFLSIFIIPRGKKYNEGYDPIELADRLEEVLTINDWNRICFFFLVAWTLSIAVSLRSSIKDLKKRMKKEKDPGKLAKMEEMMSQLQTAKKTIG